MKLEPTEDIVFFPALLTLRPSEERRIRVGSVAPAGSQEKTYRIFVEELPSLEASSGGAVRVLTKMGIPIFLRPAKEAAAGALSEVGQQNGKFHFMLSNTGTVHFVPQAITVRGLSGRNAVFERHLEGWYVLAGGHRLFDLDLPRPECVRATSLAVEVKFSSATLEERLETPAGACPP
jgi:fimbrial chaperone protein